MVISPWSVVRSPWSVVRARNTLQTGKEILPCNGPRTTDHGLNGFRPAFAGADADAVFQGQDEDLAVADAALGAGPARLHDGVDRRLDEVLVDGDLQLHLAEQVH